MPSCLDWPCVMPHQAMELVVTHSMKLPILQKSVVAQEDEPLENSIGQIVAEETIETM